MPPHISRGPLTAGPGPSENGHIAAIVDGPDPDERRRQLLAKLEAISVGLTHRKTRRQQAIRALLAYLDDDDVTAAYRLAVNGEDDGA